MFREVITALLLGIIQVKNFKEKINSWIV